MCAPVGGSTGVDVTAPGSNTTSAAVTARGDRLAAVRGDRLVQAIAARGDKLKPATPASPAVMAASFDQRFGGARREFDLGAVNIPPLGPVTAPSAPERHLATRSEAPAAPHGFSPRLRNGWRPTDAQADERAVAHPASRGIFTKLFGNPFSKLFGSRSSNVKLAYASTEGGVASDGGAITSGLYDRQTAVYDISAHMVYMPDGRKLEAHSGLGDLLDDPDSGRTKSRGVTPPNIYDLKPRESLFHGVAALRLLPEDEAKVFGRAGLLAHTFMLGPNGQSNGCVSFKDYNAFLKAYQSHEITRLAVVARIE
jgi:hypothetical protein